MYASFLSWSSSSMGYLMNVADVFHIELILCFFPNLSNMADSGQSNSATLLVHQVVVLRSRYLIDTVMYTNSSIDKFEKLTWPHRLVVRCEDPVVSMLDNCKLVLHSDVVL